MHLLLDVLLRGSLHVDVVAVAAGVVAGDGLDRVFIYFVNIRGGGGGGGDNRGASWVSDLAETLSLIHA